MEQKEYSAEMCRLCLHNGKNVPVIKIFGNPYAKNLPDIIAKTLPFALTDLGKNTNFLCYECYSKLQIMDKFLEKSKKCNDFLTGTRKKQEGLISADLLNSSTSISKHCKLSHNLDDSSDDDNDSLTSIDIKKPLKIDAEDALVKYSQNFKENGNSQDSSSCKSINSAIPYPIYNQMYTTMFVQVPINGPQYSYQFVPAHEILPSNVITNQRIIIANQNTWNEVQKQPSIPDANNNGADLADINSTVSINDSPSTSNDLNNSLDEASYSLDLNYCNECKMLLSPSTNLFNHCLNKHSKE